MAHRTLLFNRGRPEESIFKFHGNAVYTTKYTFLTFLPKFLFEQFTRYANLFFLLIAAIQQIKGVTPVNRFGTALPLAIIIIFTGVKEFLEDAKRRRADDRANNDTCEAFNKAVGKFERKKWKEITVGDLIRVREGQEFPADLVLVQSSSEEGECHVETSNIDGETNLKAKQRAPVLLTKESLPDFTGMIKCDEPNNKIYEFDGLLVGGAQEIPVGPNQLLLRGSKLQNTSWIIGVTVYTGKETKLVMNSSVTRIKRSSIEKMTNRQIVYLFGTLLGSVVISFIAFVIVSKTYTVRCPYTNISYELQTGLIVKKFLTFLVLLHNLVPISLLVTMEVIRIRLGDLIESDMDLYDEETDTPAVAKTTSLVEELGQVQYIFSDKTGTLTRNEMVLRQLCVQGQYITDLTEVIESRPGIEHLLLVMAACNTVVVKKEEHGRRSYQASSPDEVAIVEAAARLGVTLLERKVSTMTIKNIDDSIITFTVMAIFEFDSARKRMSIILKDSEGKLFLFCKGADSIIRERLAPGQDGEVMNRTEKAINDMSITGLRTLMFAYRELTTQEFTDWEPGWKRSLASIAGRKEAVAKSMELMETNLTLVGVSGVEDRLQEAVPETLQKLHRAKIKVWVLTGDKMETAVNIGFSCCLLASNTKLLQLSHSDGIDHLVREFKGRLEGIEVVEKGPQNAAIVIEAIALRAILEDEGLQELFLQAAKQCRTVICCRVSPSQKAQVVEFVQRREKAVCLAIGDGANDVGMIQAAQIGVGISGKEGLQAARSADFSVAQFRFLQKLLLVHGAWGYHRISKAALFCVYKNILLFACQFWYAGLNLFSGQTVFESWMVALYNVAFTASPPIILGLTEQFVTSTSLLSYPALYRFGQQNSFVRNYILISSLITPVV